MKSLERQLQISLAIVMSFILLALFIITNFSTRSILEEFVSSRLGQDAQRLQDNLFIDSDTLKVRWRRLNPIYNTPYSGHYYAAKLNTQADHKTLKSPSLNGDNLILPYVKSPHTEHKIIGPQEQHLVVWSQVALINNQEVIISVAEDMSLMMQNRKKFRVLFIIMGLLGFIFMLVLQRFVIHRLFKHLEHSRQEIRQIESGERQLLSEDVPTEIYPLVKEFNRSLSLMQQRMERSRNALGNLAHALKTPLSILLQQLNDSDTDKPSIAKTQAERIRQLTERELKRARMAGLGNTTQRFNPHEELPILVKILKQAHNKDQLEVNLQVEQSVKKFGDREDMLELFGNLMDNAYKWAEYQVYCSISRDKKADNIILIIEDDGIALAPKKLEQLTQRGIRLDESIEGHGLGLAICKDIVKLYAGAITFSRSPKLGGFKVKVKLPFKPNS